MTSKNLFIFVTDPVKTGKTKTLDLLAILLMVLLFPGELMGHSVIQKKDREVHSMLWVFLGTNVSLAEFPVIYFLFH